MVATDDAQVDVGVAVTGVLGCAIVVDGADETTAGNSWSQPAAAAEERDEGAAAVVERPGSDRDDLDLRAK